MRSLVAQRWYWLDCDAKQGKQGDFKRPVKNGVSVLVMQVQDTE